MIARRRYMQTIFHISNILISLRMSPVQDGHCKNMFTLAMNQRADEVTRLRLAGGLSKLRAFPDPKIILKTSVGRVRVCG
jgi:hypothetical protein